MSFYTKLQFFIVSKTRGVHNYVREGIGITPLTTNVIIAHGKRKIFINTEKSKT